MTGISGFGNQQLGGPESAGLLEQIAMMREVQQRQQLQGLSGSLSKGCSGGCGGGCCSGGGGCGGGCCGSANQAIGSARNILG